MSHGQEPFFVLSISHEVAPMEVRERYSMDTRQIENLYGELRNHNGIQESLVLNTCNRFELYVQAQAPSEIEATIELLASVNGTQKSDVSDHLHIRSGQDAVQHLIEVSAGLRSQITGEAEIFGQVKDAYAFSQKRGSAGKVINRVFQKGFQAAKLIRHTTSISHGLISIASVAVDLASKIFGKLSSASVLTLGTGEIGEKTAIALKSRGASDFGVASRSEERSIQAAADWGGRPHLLAELPRYISDYDIVIASVGSEEPILNRELASVASAERKGWPLFLIDLGLPRNIEKSCESLDNVFLYNLDDLAQIAEQNLSMRRRALDESKEIAAAKSIHIWDNIVKRGF